MYIPEWSLQHRNNFNPAKILALRMELADLNQALDAWIASCWSDPLCDEGSCGLCVQSSSVWSLVCSSTERWMINGWQRCWNVIPGLWGGEAPGRTMIWDPMVDLAEVCHSAHVEQRYELCQCSRNHHGLLGDFKQTQATCRQPVIITLLHGQTLSPLCV